MRTGLIAKKIGMSTLYSENGEAQAVTLLTVKDCEVISVKNIEKDGYLAVQIGSELSKPKNVTKPLKGHFAKNKIKPKRVVKEFRVSDDCLLKSGTEISASHFVENQYIDAQSVSKGKGFAGVIKRWNFAGLRASHGVSISHRSHGSTGQCQDPGRVPKGKKMAGQLGNKLCTIHNLRVLRIDQENGLLIVKGAMPGSKGSYVYLRDALKRTLPANAPYPNFVKETKSDTKDKSQDSLEAKTNKAKDGVVNES